MASCLSGPVDIDKLDYLQRDSLHCGVPYGRHFDADRLIEHLAVHPRRGCLAIGEKAKTAAEMMVFARYVMFSEVYWHRAVRSATAMLQRAVFLLQNRMDLGAMRRMADADWIRSLLRAAEGSTAEALADGLFGPRRRLYKTFAEYDGLDASGTHDRLARRPFWFLVAVAERLAERLTRMSDTPVHPSDVLIDAPPVKLEVDINVDVVRRDGSVVSLAELSPVASSLATHQFDHHVKRVRVFLRPDLRDELTSRIDPGSLPSMVAEAADSVTAEIA